MKIAILTTSFPRWEGDYIGNYILAVAAEHAREGHEVRVVAPHASGLRTVETLDGVGVRRFRYMVPSRLEHVAYGGGVFANLQSSLVAKLTLPLFFLSLLAQSLRVVRWADVVHAHWPLAGLGAVVAGRLLRKRVVLTLHGIEVFTKRAQLITKLCLRGSDHVICNSSATLEAALTLGTPRASSVIPFGISRDFSEPGDQVDVRARHRIVPGTVLLFSLGRLIPRKGTEYLLRAMPAVARQGNCHLIIGGDGPERGRLAQLTDQLDAKDAVTFAGAIPSDELPSYYRQSDIFVHPVVTDASGDAEGLGIVLLEAMSCQVPVIASAIGGITDVVLDGETGLLVPEKDVSGLAERIATLADDVELRRRMGAAGADHVRRRFRVEDLARATLAVYAGPGADETELANLMKECWNEKAAEAPEFYIHSEGGYRQTLEDFYASGRRDVKETVIKAGVRPSDGEVMLEIGCGAGRMTKAFAELFTTVHAIDVSETMIELARERLVSHDNVVLHTTTGTDLSVFPDNFFDFCYSYIVFQHLPTPELTLRYVAEVSRVLKPGGVFRFQVKETLWEWKRWNVPFIVARRLLRNTLRRFRVVQRLWPGPHGQEHPAFRGSAVPFSRIEAACAQHGLRITSVAGRHTPKLWITSFKNGVA